MSLFRFRTRAGERDTQTDSARLGRLREWVARTRAEIEHERKGLRARYERAVADAAFAQQAFEEGGQDSGMSIRVDELTEAVMRYYERLAALDRQAAFLADFERGIEQFAPPAGAGTVAGRPAGSSTPDRGTPRRP